MSEAYKKACRKYFEEKEKRLDFIENLKVGQLVEARFTNVFGWKRFPARIVKVNKSSVRVVRADGKPVWEGEDPNREIVISLVKMTENNGIFPLE